MVIFDGSIEPPLIKAVPLKTFNCVLVTGIKLGCSGVRVTGVVTGCGGGEFKGAA